MRSDCPTSPALIVSSASIRHRVTCIWMRNKVTGSWPAARNTFTQPRDAAGFISVQRDGSGLHFEGLGRNVEGVGGGGEGCRSAAPKASG